MPATAMTNSATAYDLNRVVMLELRTGRLLLGTRPYLNTPTWLRAGSYASEPVFAELRAHDGAMADLRRNMRHISQTLHSMMDNRDLNNVAVLETVMREVEARKIVAVFAPTVTESAQDVSMLTLSQLMKSNKLQETRQGVVDNLKQILPRVPAQAQVAGGDRAKREMEQFFAPEHLETTAGVFELWAASSGTRDGFIIDAGMLSLAITYSGKAAMEAFNNLAGFFKIIEMDKPDEDHQKSAAYLLASAFIYLGLSTMKLILRKVAGRKGSARGGGGGSDGKASSFAKRNPGALAAGPVPAPAPVVSPVAPTPKKDAAVVPAGRARTAAPTKDQITSLVKAGKIDEARALVKPVLQSRDLPALFSLLDVTSPKDKAVFWSGNLDAAKEIAKKIGGTTLEQTIGGQVLDGWDEIGKVFPQWNKESGSGPPPYGFDLWAGISRKYADGVTGKVTVAQTASRAAVGGGAVWKGAEKNTLEARQRLGLISEIEYVIVPEKPDGK
jgi:hypothetical protein